VLAARGSAMTRHGHSCRSLVFAGAIFAAFIVYWLAFVRRMF